MKNISFFIRNLIIIIGLVVTPFKTAIAASDEKNAYESTDSLTTTKSANLLQDKKHLPELIIDTEIYTLENINLIQFAQTRKTERVSIAYNQTQQTNNDSLNTYISGNGRFVAFASSASNLVQNDNNNQPDIFVYDRETKQTELISISTDGTSGNGSSVNSLAISADGRYVAFGSHATNLVLNDTNSHHDVFVRDRFENKTYLVSLAWDKTQGNHTSGFSYVGISDDGRFVAYHSYASNLVPNDNNNKSDVFVYDRENKEVFLASKATNGDQGTDHSYISDISPDGTWTIFYTNNSFVPEDNNGEQDIYMFNHISNEIKLVSKNLSGFSGNGGSAGGSFSGNGQYIVFASSATDLVTLDTNNTMDAFVYDMSTNEISLESLNSDNDQGNSNSGGLAISQYGRYVLISSSADNLIENDTNGVSDLFIRDRFTNSIKRISLTWDGAETDIGNTFRLPRMSDDGNYVAIDSSNSNLIQNDTNEKADVFVFSTKLPVPVILVHGWQGGNISKPTGYSCTKIEPFNGENSTLGSLPQWFHDTGYQVWIAHWDTSFMNGTPSLYENAKCLRDQIVTVNDINPQPITIVAHSMGGLVSRAAINKLDEKIKINQLFTIGTPHAGISDIGISLLFGLLAKVDYCQYDTATCQTSQAAIPIFNWLNPNRPLISYNFIGGKATPNNLISLPWKIYSDDDNDGLVGRYSSVGWVYDEGVFNPSGWTSQSSPDNFRQYWTDEVHSASYTGYSYYEERPSEVEEDPDWSHAFQCIKALMEGNSPDNNKCENAVTATQLQLAQPLLANNGTTLSSTTEVETGNLGDSGSVSISIPIDTSGDALFNLSWISGDFELTLTRPDAQVIDPAYAVVNPGEVTYETWAGAPDNYPSKRYYFTNAMAGEWQLNITATSAGDYWAYAMLTSPYTLEAVTNQDSYAMGDTATITATLNNNGVGLDSQTVTATLTNQDGTVSVAALADQGDGTYTNTYLIPNIPGYLQISIDADGDDNGTLFTRHTNLLVTVQPEDADLTGNYGEAGDDSNSDGLYETLDVDIEINAIEAGKYALSADLYAGDQFVAHTGDFFALTTGVQTVALSFNGKTIRNSGLDGPYTVTNILLIPTDLGLLTDSAVDALSTSAYTHTQFGVCHPLNISHTGNGSDPTATPASSTGCSTGWFVENESIQLEGAIPDLGWEIASWSGTDNDISTDATNSIIMPDQLHTVKVNYVLESTPPSVVSVTRVDPSPSNAQNVDFLVTFSEPVSGVTTGDFTLYTTGVSAAFVSSVTDTGDQTSYTVTVNTGTGNGTIRLDVVDDNTIVDAASNPLGGTGVGDGNFTSGEVYDVIKDATFSDVTSSHPYFNEIEILYANGLTAGCSASPLMFCPDTILDRAQSAVFMLRGNFGTSYTPPAAPWDLFADDWSSAAWAEKWAEGMYNAGMTAGCSASPLMFCPYDQLPNLQAAVFALRLKYGNAYAPPAATGMVFADMTNAGFWGTKWAEAAYAEGIMPSCGTDVGSGKPLFCPDELVDRGFAAWIIVQSKSLTMP